MMMMMMMMINKSKRTEPSLKINRHHYLWQ